MDSNFLFILFCFFCRWWLLKNGILLYFVRWVIGKIILEFVIRSLFFCVVGKRGFLFFDVFYFMGIDRWKSILKIVFDVKILK